MQQSNKRLCRNSSYCIPVKCSHPNILMKKSKAGVHHVNATIIRIFPLVRHALYLAAIFTEQKRSTVIIKTVNWDTKHTV